VSGREAGRQGQPPSEAASDPDELEVAPGAERRNLEAWVPELASEEERRAALEHAFDYRGDVTITLKDGTRIEGYVFDRRSGARLADSYVRLMAKEGGGKISISYAQIAALAFTGRDMAAGKSWENWVRQYWERKAAGEKDISLQPEKLD
jgi:hypothetical protein